MTLTARMLAVRAADWSSTAFFAGELTGASLWAVSADHSLVASYTDDHRLRLLTPNVTLRHLTSVVAPLTQFNDPVAHLVVLPTSRTVVAASASGTIAAWTPDG